MIIGSPAPGAPVRAPGALTYAPFADEHSSKQMRLDAGANRARRAAIQPSR